MKPITKEEILEVLQEELETRQHYELMKQIELEEQEAQDEARKCRLSPSFLKSTYDPETDTGRRIIIEDGYVIYDSYASLF